MFGKHLARRNREFMRAFRDQMIASVYANEAFVGSEAAEDRDTMIESITSNYDDAVEILHGLRDPEEAVDQDVHEAMLNDPLFGRFLRSQQPQRVEYPNEGAGQAILA